MTLYSLGISLGSLNYFRYNFSMNAQTTTPTQNAAPSAITVIEQMLRRASGAHSSRNNHISILLDSTQNFPAWEEALMSAKSLICIEMYIFAPDHFGHRIRQILLDKLAEGVTVALVYDWFGSINAHLRGFFRPLIQAGAIIKAYNPPGLSSGIGIFSRNHRKSIIIDGHTAFIGGLCISSAWEGQPDKGIDPWRDTALKIEGRLVADVFAAFTDTLTSQNGKLPEINRYSPISFSGNSKARLLATTPDNINTMRLDLNVIGLARRNLWLTDAYFMPTKMYVQSLIYAARAGVDVRILVPRTSDIRWIGTVSRTQYRRLLEAGVRVFEWDGSMIHAKSAIIDGQWARVGSTNLNFSSWYANRELDVSIEDPQTVSQLEQVFLNDLQHATEVILNEHDQAQLAERRRRMPRGLAHFNKEEAKLMLRRAMQIGQAIDASISNTREVDQSEAWSYLSIGVAILLLTVLLWLLPQLVMWPLLLILLVSGIGTTIQALKRLIAYRRSSRHKR